MGAGSASSRAPSTETLRECPTDAGSASGSEQVMVDPTETLWEYLTGAGSALRCRPQREDGSAFHSVFHLALHSANLMDLRRVTRYYQHTSRYVRKECFLSF